MSLLNNILGISGVKLSRRNFIQFIFFSGLASLFPSSVLGAVSNCASSEKSLSLYNPITKESLNTVYWSNGQYVKKALSEINHIMRDQRTGEVKPIDTSLLDLLHATGMNLKAKEPFHIISGYRSRKTNELLRRRCKNVARNSFHIQGKAADIRVPGSRTLSLRRVVINLRSGGVGYYPRSGFIHVDVGPVRYWSSR